MEELLPLLLNKTVLGVLGAIIVALFVYSKGVEKGRSSEQRKQDEAGKELQGRIDQAEADNQEIERKKNEERDVINRIDTIDELLRLWNTRQKTTRPDAKKDAPK